MKQIKNAAAAGKGIHARWGQGSVFRPTKQICCAGGHTPADECLSSPGAEEIFIVKNFSNNGESIVLRAIFQGFLRG